MENIRILGSIFKILVNNFTELMNCWDLKSYELFTIIKSLFIYLSRVLLKIELNIIFIHRKSLLFHWKRHFEPHIF